MALTIGTLLQNHSPKPEDKENVEHYLRFVVRIVKKSESVDFLCN